MGNDAMSRALQQISRSPFLEEIESIDIPWRFVKPIFTNYNGKMDPMEHVGYYNQSMTIYYKEQGVDVQDLSI